MFSCRAAASPPPRPCPGPGFGRCGSPPPPPPPPAARDALGYARRVLEIEINAVTDNPIFFPEKGEALPGGNFHGAPVAQVMDLMCIAVTDAASISERRTERLGNP